MEKFYCKTKIVTGRSAKVLQETGCKRLFLVSDPFFEKNGTAAKISSASGAQQTYIFSQITPDPTVQQVAQGTAKLKEFQPDTVAVLGGGSAMDCGKAMVYFSGLQVRFVAIPTTSGSGSEVTDFAILTHDGIKHPLIDSKLCPDMAILDSTLVEQLPRSLIADGGFDVISHALESYAATTAGQLSDTLAEKAFSTAVEMLPRSFRGEQFAREKMHIAATMAGISFSQAGLGLCHAMSHTLGGMFHLPHGRLNAILLPAVLGANAQSAWAKYAQISRIAGFGGAADTMAVRNLKNGLIRLRRELELPDTLAQAGIDPQMVWRNAARIVEGVLADPCCQTNPVRVEGYTVRRILEEVTGRV